MIIRPAYLPKFQRLAAYGVFLAEGHVLLSLLNRGPNRGKWTLVGGGIEHGEHPEEALIREAAEEAGLNHVFRPTLIDIVNNNYSFENAQGLQEDGQTIGVIYRVELEGRVACRTDPDGSSSDGCRWFLLHEVDETIVSPWVLKVLQKIRS